MSHLLLPARLVAWQRLRLITIEPRERPERASAPIRPNKVVVSDSTCTFMRPSCSKFSRRTRMFGAGTLHPNRGMQYLAVRDSEHLSAVANTPSEGVRVMGQARDDEACLMISMSRSRRWTRRSERLTRIRVCCCRRRSTTGCPPSLWPIAELVDEHLDLSRIRSAYTEGRAAPLRSATDGAHPAQRLYHRSVLVRVDRTQMHR